MLPVTTSLVRWTNVNAPTPAVSAELAGYVRSEYRENAYYANALVEQAAQIRATRTSVRSDGLLRRFLTAVAGTLAAGRASPGGA